MVRGSEVSEYSDKFAALSAGLTGFKTLELRGNGLVDTYLETLYSTIGEANTMRFLDKGGQVLEADDVEAAIAKRSSATRCSGRSRRT